MGRRFASFEDAWAAFLARDEPLESFHRTLPEDDAATLDVWIIRPSERVAAAARELQQALAHLDWIEPAPRHFLHVTLAHAGSAEPKAERPFELAYRRVGCFHDAIVVEVEGKGLRRLVSPLRELTFFLPHLTLGYVREPGRPEALRAGLGPIRETDLGTQLVEEVLLCRVPASRTTFLRPWTVLRRIALRR